MKLMIAALCVFGFNLAHANDDVPVQRVTQEVNATMGMFTGFAGEIYYECRSLKYNVERFLADLGATNIDIRCTGGLDPVGITTFARIRGSFDAYAVASGSETFVPYTELTLRDRDNCALAAELFHILDDKFVMKDIRGMGSRPTQSCTSSRAYRVTLQIVK